MITPGQAHDLACAEPLLDGADPDALIGDKAYDADPLIETLTRRQRDYGASLVPLDHAPQIFRKCAGAAI